MCTYLSKSVNKMSFLSILRKRKTAQVSTDNEDMWGRSVDSAEIRMNSRTDKSGCIFCEIYAYAIYAFSDMYADAPFPRTRHPPVHDR